MLVTSAHAELRFDDIALLDESAPPAPATVFDHPIQFSLTGGFVSQLSSDLMTGEYDVTRFDFAVGAQTRLAEKLDASFVFRTMWDGYDFSDDASLGLGSAPWEDIYTLSFGARLKYTINDRWSLAGGPAVQFARESGADWSDAATVGGTISAIYQWSESLAIGVGVGVLSQIEDDPLVIPIITVEWKLSDSLRIHSTAPTTTGLGAEIIWSFAPSWELAFGAGYASRRFRLDDEGIAPGGVGEETQFPIALRVGWQPHPHVHVTGFAGINVGTELKLESSSGAHIASEEPDGALFFGFAARLQF